MAKIPSDSSINEDHNSTSTSTETRTLRDVVYNSKRSVGNYGSLAKSHIQPIFYIHHKIESDDTLQRLALKYNVNIQEIKRVNKLWSDAELGLFEYINIPVNSAQLSTLRSIYPTLTVVQHQPLLSHDNRNLSMNSLKSDEITIGSSDSSNSIPSTIGNNSSYQDYFSKIDQQIRSTKKTLQSMNNNKKSQSNSRTDDTKSCDNVSTTIENKERHKGVHHLSDNSVFVNISMQNSHDKYLSNALQRIQREKDNFDEL